uniref:Uncharacterized protein n=1 Tax=Plectus sambesii TaxID=2011161 RepID=A0A914V078_9BILA
MKWPHGGYPRIQLSAYIALHAICIPASLLFMAFGAFKSGNLAGDNDRLGARLERVVDVGNAGCCLKKMKALWLHSPPLPQSLHLFMAFALLVAQQLMLAQLYRHGFLHSDAPSDPSFPRFRGPEETFLCCEQQKRRGIAKEEERGYMWARG